MTQSVGLVSGQVRIVEPPVLLEHPLYRATIHAKFLSSPVDRGCFFIPSRTRDRTKYVMLPCMLSVMAFFGLCFGRFTLP